MSDLQYFLLVLFSKSIPMSTMENYCSLRNIIKINTCIISLFLSLKKNLNKPLFKRNIGHVG